ncbi:MFS transporter [Microlunatus parietis]|uniref:DHA2 family multidrug resistance protein-like MFS transporter n=1 Tax=Microlunatus parietis TaxID=682979 RepID=A0A7Y9I5J1_9ACTN|nr:DHA2 family multidrug resistance protein-like MFS transporter [Microlunatus parietis]
MSSHDSRDRISVGGEAAKAGPRTWAGLAVLALPTLLVSMDLSVLILVLPSMSADLQPDGIQALWITDIYGFLIAGALITMGTLGDRLGRRRLLMIGATAFAAASTLAAFAPSPEWLIAARAVQGVAGATLMPSTLSLIRSLFHRRDERAFAISIWVVSFSVGIVLGPLLAGILLQFFWWGSVFLVNLPIMVLLLILAPVLLPESKDPSPGRFDLPGAALATATVLAAVLAMKTFAKDGPTLTAIGIGVAGLVLGYLFMRRQRTTDQPLLDLSLFKIPAFSTAVGLNLMIGMTMAGTYLFTAQYLQLVSGLPALLAALWLLPQTGALIISSTVSARLARRIRPAYLITGGMAIAIAGLVSFTQVTPDGGIAPIVIGSILTALGFGPAGTLGPDLIISSAPAERAGAAAAVSETGNELGNASGIAVLGSLGIAYYQAIMANHALPGLTEAARALAVDSLFGAVQATRGLAPDISDAVLTAARTAFTSALQLTAGAAAIAVLILAVAAAVLLRHAPTVAHDDPE